MFIYFWETESMSMEGAERGGDTESEAGSRLWAVSTEPDAGLELTNHEIITWAKVGCPNDLDTQAPQYFVIFNTIMNPIVLFISFSYSLLEY